MPNAVHEVGVIIAVRKKQIEVGTVSADQLQRTRLPWLRKILKEDIVSLQHTDQRAFPVFSKRRNNARQQCITEENDLGTQVFRKITDQFCNFGFLWAEIAVQQVYCQRSKLSRTGAAAEPRKQPNHSGFVQPSFQG